MKTLILISVVGFWIIAGLWVQGIISRNQASESAAVPEDPAESAPFAPISPSIPRVFEFNGEDLGKVLRVLARQASINMVVSDQVKGTVTLRLTDVTALRSIDIIAKSKGLFVSIIDDVYFIKTRAEWEVEPREDAEFHLKNSTLAQSIPLVEFKYGTHVQLRGDERTGTLLYRARISQLEELHEFLQWIDRPVADFALTFQEFCDRKEAAEAVRTEAESATAPEEEAGSLPPPPSDTYEAIAPLEPVLHERK